MGLQGLLPQPLWPPPCGISGVEEKSLGDPCPCPQGPMQGPTEGEGDIPLQEGVQDEIVPCSEGTVGFGQNLGNGSMQRSPRLGWL